MTFTDVLGKIDNFVWGVPLIVLIMGTGIFLTCRLGVLQFRRLGKALKYMVKNEADGIGEVSSFGALCTALAATIGTGNIVGVATAIMLGGPGAVFWMVLAACFGMATKYAEGLLAVSSAWTKAAADSWEDHSITSKTVWARSGNGWANCLHFSRVVPAHWESVPLHR